MPRFEFTLTVSQVWSWGINDNASLGRATNDVPDPDNPGHDIEPEILETQPIAIPTLAKDGFRAVTVAAGDSISVALGSKGELRAWGSFRVTPCFLLFPSTLLTFWYSIVIRWSSGI